MDFILAFGSTGKPSHAQPPAWFMMVGIAGGIVYWVFLKIRISMRHKRERRGAVQTPPPASPSDPVPADFRQTSSAVPAQRSNNGGTNEPSTDHATAIARLEHWLAYIVILAGLAGWTVIEPPPERWLPIVTFLLASLAVVVESALLWRQPQQREPQSPSDLL